MNVVPEGISKVDRSQFLTYLNTTPSGTDKTWAVLGVGITDYSVSYNPQIDSEKWIIEDTARHDHSSNEKQGSISQTVYKGDPCFEFVHAGIDKLNYTTHILDIDRWNGSEAGGVTSYPAKMSDGKIAITSKGGENMVLEYDLYYDGDPIEGTVTFSGTTPTFTPNTSL